MLYLMLQICTIFYLVNESTAGADASVVLEALKLYHMKLTLAYSSLLAPIARDSSLPEW